MDVDKPKAKTDAVCPFHRKPMRTVCHKCALWVKVMGTNPNDGQTIESWDCSFAWLPILLIENAQQSRQAGAAVESLRNEIVKIEASKLALAAPILNETAKRLERSNASDNH